MIWLYLYGVVLLRLGIEGKSSSIKAEIAYGLNDMKVNEAYALQTIDSTNIIQCVRCCNNEESCRSVFYKETSGTCQMHVGKYDEMIGSINAIGYAYYILDKEIECPTIFGYNITAQFNLCVRFSEDSKIPANADETCKHEGGHLLVITSNEMRMYIDEERPHNDHYYISGTDEQEEGNWRIWNGEPMTYLFGSNEDSGIGENCATIYTGKIADTNCHTPRRFICQIDC